MKYFLENEGDFSGYFLADHQGNFGTSERCQKQLQIVKCYLFLSLNSKQQCKPLENVLEKGHSQSWEESCNSQLHQHLCLRGALPAKVPNIATVGHGHTWERGDTTKHFSYEGTKSVFHALSKPA